jgi:hypothetical protein
MSSPIRSRPAQPHGEHLPPSACPVCGDDLSTTRLGCGSCGTEVSGVFAGCRFCGLGTADRELLGVFLASRGNLRRVERHLGVSYPTARQRFAELLSTLGIEPEAGDDGLDAGAQPVDRDDVLARLASGQLSVDEAERLLRPVSRPTG